jgi:putative ABC transport system substrate-binding protein
MQRRTFIGGSAAILGTPLCFHDAAADQPKKLPVIGFLSGASPGQGAPNVAAFREGLRETGWVEGHNVSIEYRWSEGRPGRLPGLAGDLVARKVDVIVATGDAAGLAAKNATATIPIVFFSGGDPVATGLVTSLARPGNNLTGLGIMVVELMAKRFELLAELVPHARVIALLVNPKDPNADRFSRELEESARAKGLELKILGVSSDSEIDGVFASLVQLHIDGAVVALFREREQLVALAARHAVPAIYRNVNSLMPAV